MPSLSFSSPMYEVRGLNKGKGLTLDEPYCVLGPAPRPPQSPVARIPGAPPRVLQHRLQLPLSRFPCGVLTVTGQNSHPPHHTSLLWDLLRLPLSAASSHHASLLGSFTTRHPARPSPPGNSRQVGLPLCSQCPNPPSPRQGPAPAASLPFFSLLPLRNS